MSEKARAKAGAACPQCGGAFVLDETQDPHRLIDHKQRNAANPSAADRFARSVLEKAAAHGVIHRCGSCGYRARFHAADPAA